MQTSNNVQDDNRVGSQAASSQRLVDGASTRGEATLVSIQEMSWHNLQGDPSVGMNRT